MTDSVTTTKPASLRRRLRVPSDDGQILVEPPLAEAVVAIEENKRRLAVAFDQEMQGRTVGQMRDKARSELVASAFRYTSEIRPDTALPAEFESIIVTGHQPELFHPGVWVKNFVAGEMARRTGGVAINLIVDNDECESATVRVPVATDIGLKFERIQIDEPQLPQPWEERTIGSHEKLSSFGSRVTTALKPWDQGEPIASQFEFDPNQTRLADALTSARVKLEASHGLQNLELPVSRLCQTETFLRFFCHMLVNIEQFHEVHNRVLLEYRERNNLRSKTHPVPALEPNKDGWWEAPFWSWREGEKNRNRLFAKQLSPKVLAISDGNRVLAELPLGPGMDACCAVEVLQHLASAGERIRTRALTTTIFSRLLFADIFIHGIGGAKYDEMTDEILREFYGVEPPEFMTVSATLRLLGDRATSATPDDVEKLRVRERNLRFNAQEELDSTDNSIQQLIAEKRTLIAEQQAYDGDDLVHNQERYHRFREINKILAKHTASERDAIESKIESLQAELRQNEQYRSRDFSFCMFPPERLTALFRKVGDA